MHCNQFARKYMCQWIGYSWNADLKVEKPSNIMSFLLMGYSLCPGTFLSSEIKTSIPVTNRYIKLFTSTSVRNCYPKIWCIFIFSYHYFGANSKTIQSGNSQVRYFLTSLYNILKDCKLHAHKKQPKSYTILSFRYHNHSQSLA